MLPRPAVAVGARLVLVHALVGAAVGLHDVLARLPHRPSHGQRQGPAGHAHGGAGGTQVVGDAASGALVQLEAADGELVAAHAVHRPQAPAA